MTDLFGVVSRRQFLTRLAFTAFIATPISILLRRWVVLFRAGDPIPSWVLKPNPHVDGVFGVDVIAVRGIAGTTVRVVRPMADDDAMAIYPAVTHAHFVGAPTVWDARPLIGSWQGYQRCCLRISGGCTPTPKSGFGLSGFQLDA